MSYVVELLILHSLLTALKIISSVIDNLELRDAISIYCISHILRTNVKWLFNHYRALTLSICKIIILIVKRYSTI